MTNSRIELIIHPVRLRILQWLSASQLTTQEIAARLTDVPQSSVYRHLKQLLDGGLIAVAETRLVKGIEEKRYTITQPPLITDPADVANLTADAHLRYFTIFATTLMQAFADYLDASPHPDLIADRVSYREVFFHATAEEVDEVVKALREALRPVLENPHGPGRELRKFSTILHPMKGGAEQEDGG